MISTLPSLRNNQDPKEVEAILARLTLDILPKPGVGEGEKFTLPRDLKERLVQEIRINQRLKRDDNSPRAFAKIHGYLADEMARLALAGTDVKDIKNRLGQEGELALGLYKIEFTPQFKDLHESRGVDRAAVEETLRNPSAVEHLTPDSRLGVDPANKSTSLYLKDFRNRTRPGDNYSLLVFCRRKGYIQYVDKAWVLFHSDVDLSESRTPLDVLKAFVGKYGLEFTVGTKTGRFFWNESVEVPAGQSTEYIQAYGPSVGQPISVTFEQGDIQDNFLPIVYAFTIDDMAYNNDLVRHGIRINQDAIHNRQSTERAQIKVKLRRPREKQAQHKETQA